MDAWTWVKVGLLMAFAVGVGLLKRRLFEEELKEKDDETH